MNAFDDLIRNGNKRLKRLKMVCMNLGFTLVLTILVTMTAMIDQSDNTIAQNQTTAPTSGSVTNFTRLVEDKKAAYNLSITDLGVLYESPTTLVLWGNSFDSLGEVIDIAKRNGYKIDSMTVSFQPGDYSGIIYFNEEFTIIMSKE